MPSLSVESPLEPLLPSQLGDAVNASSHGETLSSQVTGVKLIKLVQRGDHRGDLAVLGQGDAPLPFVPVRLFLTYRSNELSRGAHAHRACEQLLICVTGKVRVLVDDGVHRQVVALANPSEAVYIPPMVWAEEFEHSPDAVILVLASHPYDEADYIRDRAQWEQLITNQKN
jgi:UDP-2-acetamido-3-amino-2,3-dideoxy-glucuronate N-acetyltransferase